MAGAAAYHPQTTNNPLAMTDGTTNYYGQNAPVSDNRQIANNALFTSWHQKTIMDGSHRDGLARVPFDGYVAQLHKDERVLTAPQAAAYGQPPVMQVSFTVPDWLTMARPGATEQPIQSVTKLEALLQDAVAALAKLQAEMAANSAHAEANVAVNQAGYKQMLDKMQRQIDALEQNVRRGRMAVPK